MDKAIEKVKELAKPIVEAAEMELVDVEFVKEGVNNFLRVIIDKAGGVDIDDCSRVSEQVSDQLDIHDPIADSYFLEVCSPGAERPLRNPEEIQDAIGEYVYIRTEEAIKNGKEFTGYLRDYQDDTISLEVNKKIIKIEYANVDHIRLSVKL